MDDRTTELGSRSRRFARRSVVLASLCGFILAALVSAGVVGERLRAGSVHTALIVDALVLVAGIVVTTLTSRPLNLLFAAISNDGDAPILMRLRPSVVAVPQLVGMMSGIALVHLILRRSNVSALTWMCECPPQFVNDIVATVGTFAAVWACAARRIRIDLLIATLGLLLLYGHTRQHWHVDRAPFPFEMTIQELVVAQVIATATGLLAFRRFSSS